MVVLRLVLLAAGLAAASPALAQPLRPAPVVDCQALLRAMHASFTWGGSTRTWIEGLGDQWPSPELIPFFPRGFQLDSPCVDRRFERVLFPSGEEIVLMVDGVENGAELLLLFHLERAWPTDGYNVFSAQFCIKLELSEPAAGKFAQISCDKWPLERERSTTQAPPSLMRP